jgi:hypothetical protein
MKCGSHMLALVAALLALGGCSLGGRIHLGAVWLEA